MNDCINFHDLLGNRSQNEAESISLHVYNNVWNLNDILAVHELAIRKTCQTGLEAVILKK